MLTTKSVCWHLYVFLPAKALLISIPYCPKANVGRLRDDGTICRVVPMLAECTFFSVFDIQKKFHIARVLFHQKTNKTRRETGAVKFRSGLQGR